MRIKMRLIALAAGGTGGHMFPAEATARALLARGHRVLLVTDLRGAQHAEKLVDVAVRTISAEGVAGRGGVARAVAVLRLGGGLIQAWRLIARLRPDIAIGFGGYAALPTMTAAYLSGLPTALHEQNAMLGRANRLLAPRMRLIATSFEDTRAIRAADRRKVVVTGNPVRAEIAAVAALPYPSLGPGGRFNLLITGGSQGARVLGRVVPAAVRRLPPALRQRFVIAQQVRPEDHASVAAIYRDCGVEAELRSFFDDMPARLAACHLMICRAGASTCAELAAAGRPAILVPYPHAIDDHQMANAQAIDATGGAWLIPESSLDEAKLAGRIESLAAVPETLMAAARSARALGRADAADRLASLVERMLPANGDPDTFKAAAE